MRLLCIFALVLYWNSCSKAAPSIESPVITKITEGEPVGSVLVTVKATTTRGNLSYDIVSPTDAKTWFTINSTGTISVKKEPDREDSAFGSGGAMIMEVYVSDSDGGTKGTVYCTVIDVNDNVPQFTNLPNVINITEDTKVSSEVFTVLATDKDFGSYSRITYGITSGNEDGMFQIDIANGVISTVKSLDFEKRTRYTLSISATDECKNCSLSNSSTLVITVQDADDLPANFSQTLYQANIDKDSRPDSSVIKVYAEDLDSFKAPVTYGIHPGSNIENFFAINTNSGQITVNKPLVEGKYTLVVTAKSTDQTEAFAIVQVTVGSTNVTYEASVAENRANIFVFNLKVIQRHFNMSNATFDIISGNTGNLFVANNNTKNLTLGSTPLDRELKSRHVLIVKAQEGEKEGIAKIKVTVADKNDNKPVFQSATPSFSVSVREDITEVGTTLATVHATDRDEGQNGLIVYDILDGNNQGEFSIENRTGIITLAKTLDRETTDQYVLNISATDSGSPPLVTTVQLNVSVLDANDNSPVLTNSNPMEIEIAEDATPGTLVITVIAQDKDVLENSRIVYSIISDADGKFLIDSRTGAITTTSSLDREMQDVFKLKVRARDNGTFPRSVMAYVTVKVTDINDNKPVFSPESYTGVVYVDSLLGSIIAMVQATDKDTGVNGKLTYEIVSGNDENLFYVDGTSGIIRTSAPFDEKNKEKFTIGLRVSDAGTPTMTSTTEATVSVFVASSDESVVLYAGVKPEFALKNKEQLADVLSNLSGGKSFIQFIQPRSNNSTKVTFVSVKDDKLMTVEEQRSAINQNLTSDDKWNIECCWASTATLKTDSSARNGDEGISAVVGALICLGVFIGVAGIIMIIILLRKRKREAPNKKTVTFNDKPLYIDPEGSPTTPRNVDRAREAREGSFQAQNDEDEEGSDTSSDNYQHANYAFDEETGLSIFQEDQESDYHDFATFLSPPPPPTVPPPPPPVLDEDETAEANYKNMFQGGHNSYNEEVSSDDEGNTIDEEGDNSSPGSIDSFNYLMSEVTRNVEDVDSGYHDYNPERYSMNLQTTEL